MHKIVRIGSRRSYGGRWYGVFCEITLKDGRLSIHGVEGPLASGNCLGACGQILDHLTVERYAPGWNTNLLSKFVKTWDRWHLNDMRLECEHQRARGEAWKTHPSAVCPDCGYRLGSAWLVEPIPANVVTFLESLPETDRKPAWV